MVKSGRERAAFPFSRARLLLHLPTFLVPPPTGADGFCTMRCVPVLGAGAAFLGAALMRWVAAAAARGVTVVDGFSLRVFGRGTGISEICVGPGGQYGSLRPQCVGWRTEERVRHWADAGRRAAAHQRPAALLPSQKKEARGPRFFSLRARATRAAARPIHACEGLEQATHHG